MKEVDNHDIKFCTKLYYVELYSWVDYGIEEKL